MKELKNKKAAGPDGLCNELLKSYTKNLLNAMKHVFNIIMKNGNYPRVWNSNIITPIHKSGDKNDPQNYRGIAVGNSLNKLFTKIINRLYQYFSEQNFWKPNQNGFMKGKRTDDNLFIIHTRFQKYVKQGKKKGLCYIC